MADGDGAAIDVDDRGSQPMSLLTAQACAAKASLASMRSRSPIFQPAFLSALRDAGIGPVPMMAGSTPAVAQETMRASGSRPRRLGLGFAHQDDRGGAVIDAGGIAGGDGAVLVEGGAQLGKRIERRAMADIFVLVDDDVAFLREA
jgi:hypothetical protein